MSLSVSIRRTAAATAVLGLAALGLVGGLAPALAGSDAPRALVGGSGPDPAFKRVGEVARSRTATTTTSAARTGTVAGSTSYSFSTLLDGSPVRWDPCTPIRWTSNTSRGPAGGLDVLKAAVARVASLTGTTWEYVGASTAVPRASYLPTRAQSSSPPVLIGWTDAASSDLLAGQT